MNENFFPVCIIILGITCLFFPGIIVFGLGASGFDWVVVLFQLLICSIFIIYGMYSLDMLDWLLWMKEGE